MVLFLASWSLWPHTSAAQTPAYTFVLRGVALDDALESFSQTTGVAVAYAPRLTDDRKAYCVAREAPAEAVLQCILQESGLDFYRLSSGTYVLTAPAEVAPARGYLTGRVADRQTGSPIADAHVQLADAGVGTVTGPSGRFTLPPLLPGQYIIQITHVAYRTWQDTLHVTARARTRTEAALQPEPIAIAPVVIDGLQPRTPASSLGRAGFDRETRPAGWAASAASPLRQLNTLPGVRVNDLTADVHVQGSRSGDHQLRLDGVPVYLPRTLAGLIGPFSPFAIDRITVKKAGFGVAAGSQLAGIIDARHALATNDRADLQIDPLSLNARLQLTPSLPGIDEAAVMAATRVGLGALYEPPQPGRTLGRWSTLDPFLLRAVPAASNTSAITDLLRASPRAALPEARFMDLHAAARLRLSPLRTVHVSGYRGRRRLTGSAWTAPDALAEEARPAPWTTLQDDYRWDTLLGQMRYEAVLGSHTLFQAQLRGSRYRLHHDYTLVDSLHGDATSGALQHDDLVPLQDENSIRTAALEGTIDYAWGRHDLQAGLELTRTESAFTLHGVRLARADGVYADALSGFVLNAGAGRTASSVRHRRTSHRLAAFVRDRIALGDRWTAELGARFTYHAPRAAVYAEPRLALRYDRTRSAVGAWSMRTAAGLYRQFTYQTDASVLDPGALLPSVRVWLPLDASVAPPRVYHLSHEVRVQPHSRWTLRVEGYAKLQPHHLALRYASADEAAQSGPLRMQARFLTPTRGHALGGSVSATWNGPQVRLRLLYGYEHVRRQSPTLFGGHSHPAPWEVPHRAEVGVDWTPTAHWTLSLRGRGLWNRPWGFRHAYYDYFGHDIDTRTQPPFDLGRPGNHRLPPLYQLDASLAYARDVGPVTLQARLEVLNLTGRANVADWRLVRAGDRWQKAPRHLYPRLPTLALHLQF